MRRVWRRWRRRSGWLRAHRVAMSIAQLVYNTAGNERKAWKEYRGCMKDMGYSHREFGGQAMFNRELWKHL